jgi:hypothetical protein
MPNGRLARECELLGTVLKLPFLASSLVFNIYIENGQNSSLGFYDKRFLRAEKIL